MLRIKPFITLRTGGFASGSSRRFIVAAICLALIPLGFAWGQAAIYGLPYLAPVTKFNAATFTGVHGFPWWLRWAHFFNFVFLMMLVRSGLSILVDHPRLYFNNGCTPGTEWIRFTPLKVPTDRVWRASDDDRYISPLVAIAGLSAYRRGGAVVAFHRCVRVHSHRPDFYSAAFRFGAMGEAGAELLGVLPQAWTIFVHYANFHFPPEPDGFYAYNALQQIAYFFVVFIFAPISIVAGAAMSPAMVNHFPWFPRIFGGRQGARSIHFLMMLGWVGFLVVHVSLVVLTGFERNMNHIVLGTDNYRPLGMVLGFVGLAAVIASWIAAHYISWKAPRLLQHVQKFLSMPIRLLTQSAPSQEPIYERADLAPLLVERHAARA